MKKVLLLIGGLFIFLACEEIDFPQPEFEQQLSTERTDLLSEETNEPTNPGVAVSGNLQGESANELQSLDAANLYYQTEESSRGTCDCTTTNHNYIKLNASGPSNAGVLLRNDGADQWYMYMHGSDSQKLKITDWGSGRNAMTFEKNGDVGVNTSTPLSEFHVHGEGETVEMIISPENQDQTSRLKMCQDPSCVEAAIWRYDGGRDALYLYFADGDGTGYDSSKNKIAFKIHDGSSTNARVGINLPKSHDIQNELEVGGKILAEEIEVVANIADYVFDDNYQLMSLEKVADYIDKNHHLPGIASEKEVQEKGGTVPLGKAYTQLLEKIEELTLYTIAQNKQIRELRESNGKLARRIEEIGASYVRSPR